MEGEKPSPRSNPAQQAGWAARNAAAIAVLAVVVILVIVAITVYRAINYLSIVVDGRGAFRPGIAIWQKARLAAAR